MCENSCPELESRLAESSCSPGHGHEPTRGSSALFRVDIKTRFAFSSDSELATAVSSISSSSLYCPAVHSILTSRTRTPKVIYGFFFTCSPWSLRPIWPVWPPRSPALALCRRCRRCSLPTPCHQGLQNNNYSAKQLFRAARTPSAPPQRPPRNSKSESAWRAGPGCWARSLANVAS